MEWKNEQMPHLIMKIKKGTDEVDTFYKLRGHPLNKKKIASPKGEAISDYAQGGMPNF